MGPPLWSQTLDAYDCIMVPIQDWSTEYKVVTREMSRGLRLHGPSLNLDSAVGAKQSSGKLLMLNQCLCLESSTMANPFGEAL